MTRDDDSFPPRRTKRLVPAAPPIMPDMCRHDFIIVDDPLTATDEDVLIAKIRLHLIDAFGGTLMR